VTVHAPLGRRLAPCVTMAVGGALVVIGSFLPWVRAGSRSRNSYDLFRVVGRLGFAPDGPAATALRWWPVVPLLTVVAVVAVWWGWGRAGGVLGILAAAYAGGIGAAVAAAPGPGLLAVGAGPGTTAAGGVVLLGGAVAAVVVGAGTAPASSPSVSATRPGG
jgi:hypothetical protein